jgi:4-hydroxybenzoate polyprenyltransferase
VPAARDVTFNGNLSGDSVGSDVSPVPEPHDIERRLATSTGGLTTLDAAVRPLWHRIRLGEGGLIGMTTWAAAWQSRDAVTTGIVSILTALLLAALYLFNDVSDRVIDASNRKKVPRDRAPLVRQPRLFLALALAMHATVCAGAWTFLGGWAGLSAAALLVLNPFYSAVAKRIPVLDVVVVGAMGGTVVGLATANPSLLLLAATMTAISHGFQTRVDVAADLAAGVSSSGTAPAPLRAAIWLGLALAFAAAAYPWLGPFWAASAIGPYALLSGPFPPNRAWAIARIHFAAVWVAATVR